MMSEDFSAAVSLKSTPIFYFEKSVRVFIQPGSIAVILDATRTRRLDLNERTWKLASNA